MLKIFSVFFLFFGVCFPVFSSSDLQNEGYFFHIPMKDALKSISLFLPPSPNICLLGDESDAEKLCLDIWPSSTIIFSNDVSKDPIDFVWVLADKVKKTESTLLQKIAKQAKAVYISGMVPSNLEFFFKKLNLNPFLSLFNIWKNKEEKGFFFLEKSLQAAYVRSLNFDPEKYKIHILEQDQIHLKNHFKEVGQKNDLHSFSPIDYIYMINLDERPEKFSLSCKELHPYNFFPHRFSAVNGWKLPFEAIEEVGVKFQQGMLENMFLGTVFKKTEERETALFQLINQENTTYFCPGMTRGAIGIILSHLSILQNAYESGHNIIWIMEDDITVLQDPQKLIPLIDELQAIDPEWDILFTDKDTKNQEGQYVPCHSLSMRPNFPIVSLSHFLQKNHPISQNLSSTGLRFGAYSMIVHRSGMKKILDFYGKYRIFLPYDADFWLDNSLRMYHPNEDIVSTIPTALSDNSKPTY